MDSLLLTTKQLEHIGLAVLSFIGYKQTNKIYLNISEEHDNKINTMIPCIRLKNCIRSYIKTYHLQEH